MVSELDERSDDMKLLNRLSETRMLLAAGDIRLGHFLHAANIRTSHCVKT